MHPPLFIPCRSVSYANDSTNQCIPLALPTTIDVSTTMSTIASTPAHPDTTHPHTQTTQLVTQATNESTPAKSMPTDGTFPEHLSWPIIVGSIVVATILLASLIAVCYCCYRSKSSKKKSLPMITTTTTSDVESDNTSDHFKISLRDLNSKRMRQDSVKCHPSDNLPTTLGTSYDPGPEGSPTSITRLLKDNPASSEACTQQYSRRSSPETEFRQRQSLSTIPGTMHGGIYSTRTPPSHPHRFSATPRTHRGSLSSVQGGTSSRSSGVPSRSSNITTANNSQLELRTSAIE